MGDEQVERRDKLLTLVLAMEAGVEATSALLRMAILDVRQALGLAKRLDG